MHITLHEKTRSIPLLRNTGHHFSVRMCGLDVGCGDNDFDYDCVYVPCVSVCAHATCASLLPTLTYAHKHTHTHAKTVYVCFGLPHIRNDGNVNILRMIESSSGIRY